MTQINLINVIEKKKANEYLTKTHIENMRMQNNSTLEEKLMLEQVHDTQKQKIKNLTTLNKELKQ